MLIRAKDNNIVINSKFIIGIIYNEEICEKLKSKEYNIDPYKLPYITIILSNKSSFDNGRLNLYYESKDKAKEDIDNYYNAIKNRRDFSFSDIDKEKAYSIISEEFDIEYEAMMKMVEYEKDDSKILEEYQIAKDNIFKRILSIFGK